MKKKLLTSVLLILLLFSFTAGSARAQIPGLSLVTGIFKKVIVAIDLKVQQLQNETIALQNAEQNLENQLHLSGLNNISGWLGKEKDLYSQYYQELGKVRALIASYEAVKDIISRQQAILSEYRQASGLFSRDKHFSAGELQYMANVYNGILQESLANLDELTIALTAVTTQMSDGDRLQRIAQAAKGMQTNLDHLRQFNRQNVALSLARSKDEQDQQSVKSLYGVTTP